MLSAGLARGGHTQQAYVIGMHGGHTQQAHMIGMHGGHTQRSSQQEGEAAEDTKPTEVSRIFPPL